MTKFFACAYILSAANHDHDAVFRVKLDKFLWDFLDGGTRGVGRGGIGGGRVDACGSASTREGHGGNRTCRYLFCNEAPPLLGRSTRRGADASRPAFRAPRAAVDAQWTRVAHGDHRSARFAHLAESNPRNSINPEGRVRVRWDYRSFSDSSTEPVFGLCRAAKASALKALRPRPLESKLSCVGAPQRTDTDC